MVFLCSSVKLTLRALVALQSLPKVSSAAEKIAHTVHTWRTLVCGIKATQARCGQ